MCGIAAIYQRFRRPVDRHELATMTELLSHRGPDDSGIFISPSKFVGLGHSRLAIMDINMGIQPMTMKRHGITVTYNGEIYDCDRLRATLTDKGCAFYTRCDTEVLLNLYSVYGLDMFDHLNGEFAFVLWDEKRQRMIATRDRLGIKPLYYFKHASELIFASEVKSILALNRTETEASPNFLLSSMMGHFVGQESFFNNIQAVKAGHYMLVDEKGISEHAYWKPRMARKSLMSLPEASEQLHHLMNQAVKRRLVADVPVGLFLSGGLDSTVIAALAADHASDLNAFTIGFKGAHFDESDAASQSAKALGLKHHTLSVSTDDMIDNLNKTLYHIEMPISSPQPLGMVLLSKYINDHGIKSCLNGDGADELFAGYPFYKYDHLRLMYQQGNISRSRFQTLSKKFLSEETNTKMMLWYPAKGKNIKTFNDQFICSQLLRYNSTSLVRKLLFSQDVKQHQKSVTTNANAFLNGLLESNLNDVDFNRKLHYQQLTQCIFRMQGDNVQMAHSVESRIPFLDNDVMDFADQLPIEHLIDLNTMQEKYIVHKAFANKLPTHIQNKRKVPYHAGLTWYDYANHEKGRAQWKEKMNPSAIEASGLFNATVVKTLCSIHNHTPNTSLLHKKLDSILGQVFTAMCLLDDFQPDKLAQRAKMARIKLQRGEIRNNLESVS